jgi:hypothetical protein
LIIGSVNAGICGINIGLRITGVITIIGGSIDIVVDRGITRIIVRSLFGIDIVLID